MLRVKARSTLMMILMLIAATIQVATAQEAKLWATKSYVTIDEGIELKAFWRDLNCSEYRVVFFRTYPNGTTVRIPEKGYGEALKSNSGAFRFDGERVGKHVFSYELYCGTSHVTTSNHVEVIVVKGNSSLRLYAYPERVLKGSSVELRGYVTPRVSGSVLLEIISPSNVTRREELKFNGNFSHRISLNESGTWRFRASWDGNVNYSGASSEVTVEVEESPVRVQVMTSPPGLKVYVDGRAYEGGGDFYWIEGSRHNLSAEPMVTLDGRRYVFAGWRGKGSSVNLSLEVRQPEVYVAEYRVQYYLNVTSELGEAEGSGWYDAGSYARATLRQGKVENFPWVYVFSGWEGDAKGEELTSEPILMDGPKLAMAKWERRIDPYGLALIVTSALVLILGAFSLHLLHKYRKLSRVRGVGAKRVVRGERERRIREKIAKLEEMRRRGDVPERVYRRLKEEYALELRRLKEGKG